MLVVYLLCVRIDHVFGMDVGTVELYKKLAMPIVFGVMEGINGK